MDSRPQKDAHPVGTNLGPYRIEGILGRGGNWIVMERVFGRMVDELLAKEPKLRPPSGAAVARRVVRIADGPSASSQVPVLLYGETRHRQGAGGPRERRPIGPPPMLREVRAMEPARWRQVEGGMTDGGHPG